MTSIGRTSDNQPYAISAEDRRRHLHVIGQTGTGKSTLIGHLLADDLASDRGLALFDPHGDLAETALSFVPKRRHHHLVYVNPSDLERPIAYNILENVPADRRPAVADGAVAAFKHVWPDFFGPRMEYILLNTIRALLDHAGSTLLGIPRLLLDDLHRSRVLKSVKDPVVRGFFTDEYASYDQRFRSEAISPILNKLGRVLSSPAIRNIVAQPKSTIDLRKMMDEERILIANLSKGAIGEGNAHLLGAILIAGIANAALSRSDTNDRPLFHLYADEFQTIATDSFSLILSEARKYGLALTLSHQFLGQLPEGLRAAVMGNTGSVLSFRLGAEDAPLMASHLGLGNESALKDLPNFHAWGRFLRAGSPTSPVHLETYPLPPPVNPDVDRLIANSRSRFGRPRAEVEERIGKFLKKEKKSTRHSRTRW